MKAAYRGKENKNGRLRRFDGILCPIPLFLIDGDRRDCPLRKVGMTTLQLLDMIKMDNKPVSRYNMYMRSSTSPLFTLPPRFSLVCAIMEFLTCFLSQTKGRHNASLLSVVLTSQILASRAARTTSEASRRPNKPKAGFVPTISTTSIFPLQSPFCERTTLKSMKSISTVSPSNNPLSPSTFTNPNQLSITHPKGTYNHENH